MQFSYKTIKDKAENVLLKEKGSKFIGFAYPIENEEDIKNILEKIYDLHPKATHHCYAFRLGMYGENFRAADDGEPSGSAGLPIYNQLLANEITNVLVAVVRYFGGTKLGVGGLAKTYKESAKITLEQCEIIEKEPEAALEIYFDFAEQNAVFTLLNKFGVKISDFKSEGKCTLKALVKTSAKEKLAEKLSEMYKISYRFAE